MNLAIDIDDVLLQNTKAFIEFLSEEGYNVKYEDFTSRRIWEILGCSKSESEKLIVKFYHSNNFKNMKMIPDADKALAKLIKEFKLNFVTNRPEFTRETTLSLINRYFGDLTKEIIFLGQFQKELHEESAKKKIIEDKLKCKYFIEDDIDVINQIDTKKVKIIIFSQPWNIKAKDTKSVKRVSSWNEIEEYILGESN